jgi:hypothetical protein
MAAAPQDAAPVPENVYRGELVSFPGAWNFTIGRSSVILVSDDELEALSDPDRVIDLSMGFKKETKSLRQICEQAKAAGQRTLIVAFDHFFAQYRPGQAGKPRLHTPDKDEYIQRIAAISQFAQQYGLGLELSLMSPLEIGPGYTAETGESGAWMQYREGLRDPGTGAYSVDYWRQLRWANNKGPLSLQDAGILVYAFREHPVHGTTYSAVDPRDIVDISDTAKVEVFDGLRTHGGDYESVRVRVYGAGGEKAGPRDRVLVVQCYRTPEMDYFSEHALPYLTKLGDKYADAGVKLNALYSDEMHIQQDWSYFGHHDLGEFALRYVSPGFARRFAERFGEEYTEFPKYLVYFAHGQHTFTNDVNAKAETMHVFGPSPEEIAATALFRARYYELLQDGVVDLFVGAKKHLEERMGFRLEARAHATWAESPTIDHWDVGQQNANACKYEYTPNFVWSNTVHQAASACQDYFKWGDFLTGNGNDHAEGGWLDRNYTGLVLAASTGILNDVPNSYGAHWGMPDAIARRRQALVNACGASARTPYGMVQNMAHRDAEVLMLYPLDLVAVDERFGSWMTQYAYANYITQAKLLERGKVDGAAIEVAGRRFTTLVALFEPFPRPELLAMMKQFMENGGRVIWSGPPPVIQRDGASAVDAWSQLAGVQYTPTQGDGVMAAGQQVRFEGLIDKIAPMPILTDFLVDRTYPVIAGVDTKLLATVKGRIIGTQRTLPNSGSLTVLAFRPRDDQSQSLGYEARWWFEILTALGAYPGTGKFDTNDNPEYLSRTTDLLACRFPNGAVAVAPHLRTVEECWPGGFARNAEEDKKLVEGLTLPSEHIALKDFRIAGHTVTVEAEQNAVCFRTNAEKKLVGFAGSQCDRITVDGVETRFADQPMGFASWAPVEAECRVDANVRLQMFFLGAGVVRIPLAEPAAAMQVFAQGVVSGSRGPEIPCRIENGALVFTVGPEHQNRFLYALAAPPAQ